MKRILILALALFSLTLANAGWAHFKLNLNVRIFHVVHGPDGLEIFLRTPMPYLVADKIGPVGADGLPAPAPYTKNRVENETLMHVVDADALSADPLGLARIASDGLLVEIGGRTLAADVVSVRVHRVGSEPGFATRDEARNALATGAVVALDANDTYVGDTVVDVYLRFPAGHPIDSYSLSALADPGLPGQEETANLILDYRGETTRTFRNTGLMNDPVYVSGSAAAAASTFIVEGIRHILEGLDHVLFVLCMIIGAASLRSLLGRVTGFTVGHTVTLILGFFGLAPHGAWFIPAVETAIALSIIFAATDAVLRAGEHGEGRDRYGVLVTGLIGLLHGFGFSFMLHNILQVDAPNVWQSLLAFNVGVEIGQLLIVAAVWPIVLFLRARPAPTWRIASGTVASVASLIAAVWVIQRAGTLLT